MTAAVLSPRVRNELTAATRWISKNNRAAARGLRETVAAAAGRIDRHPAIGDIRNDFLPEPYRFVSLTGLPYVIVYNVERNPPLIVAVLHTARDLQRVLRDVE
ncbi:MAG TPA: type II toxin-antitoxin system RelE/ParE family toxin [Stellaceae bacterium]|nr:type II toxin-antitoxin system RelE/ParE family toxin [Stellaceae bacterium]